MQNDEHNKLLAVILVLFCVLAIVDTIRADWPLPWKLTASDGAALDHFGRSVCIDGNYVIVGASADDDNGVNSGSAYIFEYYGGNWNQKPKLTASDGSEFDLFGYSVAISGSRAIIGAFGDEVNGYCSGSAYIFEREQIFIPPNIRLWVWRQKAKLTASDSSPNKYFGWVVSIDGDYAIVGAPGDSTKGEDAGAAYIFEYDGIDWVQKKKLTASDGTEYDEFGISVSIRGSYVIVGASGANGKGPICGAAYIFKRETRFNPPVWLETAKIFASDGDASDYFGCLVDIDGKYAIVGAYFDEDKAVNAGSAYIFEYDGANWLQKAKLFDLSEAAENYFGSSVSISGNYAVVGSFGFSRAAYIFTSVETNWGQELGWIQPVILTTWSIEDSDRFGREVSIDGGRVVAGAINDDDNGQDAGAAYIFTICPPADLTGDCFVNFYDFATFAEQWLH